MEQAGGYVTTHVLDTAYGLPAAGMRIDVYRLGELENENRSHIISLVTNADGRTDRPAIAGADMAPGSYELLFHAGAYLRQMSGACSNNVPFLDEVPIRFGIDDATQHYHVPLLLSPFGYSTYRGS